VALAAAAACVIACAGVNALKAIGVWQRLAGDGVGQWCGNKAAQKGRSGENIGKSGVPLRRNAPPLRFASKNRRWRCSSA